ncbi:formin-like protein 3 [Penaeus monodon]|uniref:formin-like protein 3 n=1 Tax=Penaeus monodon TaxID=6687 RepID=UPI0018A6F3A3|nr:formin-like protein 3 [Penaeus monodon]
MDQFYSGCKGVINISNTQYEEPLPHSILHLNIQNPPTLGNSMPIILHHPGSVPPLANNSSLDYKGHNINLKELVDHKLHQDHPESTGREPPKNHHREPPQILPGTTRQIRCRNHYPNPPPIPPLEPPPKSPPEPPANRRRIHRRPPPPLRRNKPCPPPVGLRLESQSGDNSKGAQAEGLSPSEMLTKNVNMKNLLPHCILLPPYPDPPPPPPPGKILLRKTPLLPPENSPPPPENPPSPRKSSAQKDPPLSS